MAFNYEGRSIAPLMGYANKPIYQVLRTEEGYFENSSKKHFYIDLRDSKGYTGEYPLGKKAFGFLKTFAGSSTSKSLGRKNLEYTSKLYEKCVGKIKKIKATVLLSSDLPRAGISYSARFANMKLND